MKTHTCMCTHTHIRLCTCTHTQTDRHWRQHFASSSFEALLVKLDCSVHTVSILVINMIHWRCVIPPFVQYLYNEMVCTLEPLTLDIPPPQLSPKLHLFSPRHSFRSLMVINSKVTNAEEQLCNCSHFTIYSQNAGSTTNIRFFFNNITIAEVL